MSQFEFSNEQNKTITLANNSLLIMGSVIAISGAFVIIRGFIQGTIVSSLIEGVLEILIGIMFIRPKDNFSSIVKTEGEDISQLMTAFRELAQAGIVLIILLALLLVNTLFGGLL